MRLMGLMGLMAVLAAGLHGAGAIIPADRIIDWDPGVRGGIPNRTTIHATVSLGSNAATNRTNIQNALNSCPSGQVVMVPAGDYSYSGTLSIPSNVTLRGAGMEETRLRGSSGFSGNSLVTFANGWNTEWSGTARNLVSPTKGATTITTTAAHGWSVGDVILIDSLEQVGGDPEVNHRGTISNNGNGCSHCSRSSGTRPWGQLVKVTGTPTTTTATIDPALYYSWPNSPQGLDMGGYVEFGGIEELTLDNYTSGVQDNITLFGAVNCWMYKVRSEGCRRRHIWGYGALWWQADHCHFDGTDTGTGPGADRNSNYQSDRGYGPFLGPNFSAGLFQHSVFSRLTMAITFEGAAWGNVFAYNKSRDIWWTDTDNSGSIRRFSVLMHGAHPGMNLIEGNWCADRFRSDNQWGTSSHFTYLRNRVFQTDRGNFGDGDGQKWTIDFERYNEYYNVVGNVIGGGTDGTGSGGDSNNPVAEQTYELINGESAPYAGPSAAMKLGYITLGTGASGYDSGTLNTMIRWLNWVYDSSDSPGTQSGIANHTANVGDTNNLTAPDSLYLDAKPSAFSAAMAWPPYDNYQPGNISPLRIPAGVWDATGEWPEESGGGGPGDTTPPEPVSATINLNGDQLTLVMDEATTRNSGTPTVSLTGGAATLTYSSGSGSTAHVYSLSRVVQSDESGTVAATLGANAWEDAAGNDVVTFSGLAVTNNSGQPFPEPGDEVVDTTFDSNTTAHQVVMPASTSAGQALVILFSVDGAPTVTTPSGWTQLSDTAAGTANRLAIFAKVATGSEGGTTVNVVTSAAERAVARVYQFSDWAEDLDAITVGTAATGASANPDPPSVTSAAVGGFNIFIAVEANNGIAQATSYPANFTGGVTAVSDGDGSVGLSSATRAVAIDTLNPGTFTISSTPDWVAQTVCIASAVTGDVTAPTITGIAIPAGGTSVTYSASEPLAGTPSGFALTMSGGAVTVSGLAVNGSTVTGNLSRTVRAGETGTGSGTTTGVTDTTGNALANFSGISVTNGSQSDVTAPTPNPMTFSTAPVAVSSTAVQMVASLATDAHTGPVVYNFDETTGNAGATDSGQQSSRTYLDTGLSAGTLYTYRVTAFDAASPQNAATYSSGSNVTTLALPATATGLTATANGQTAINLAWTDVATGETGYEVYRGTSMGFTPGAGNRIAVLGANANSYADSQLNAGTAYYYTVRAYRNPTVSGPPVDYGAYATEATDTTEAAAAGEQVRRPRWWARWPWNWWR